MTVRSSVPVLAASMLPAGLFAAARLSAAVGVTTLASLIKLCAGHFAVADRERFRHNSAEYDAAGGLA